MSMPEADRKKEIKRLSELNMEIGAMMARVLDASVVIPSAGNLVFYESLESPINKEIALPFDFVDFAREKYPALSSKTYPLLAGDFVLKTKGQNEIHSAHETREGFFKSLDQFLLRMSDQQPQAKSRKQLEPGLVDFLKDKFKDKELPSFALDLYFVRRDLPEQALHVDMRNYSADVVERPEKHEGSISFSIQNHAFEMWIRNEINFETLLNSQRLFIYRSPEVFERPVWDVIRTHF